MYGVGVAGEIIMKSTDEMIIRMLRENSRTPFLRIAEEAGVSEGTIRNRVRSLVKKGVIKRFTIDTAGQASSVIMVSTSTSVSTRKTAEEIKKLGASGVLEVAGKSDIICFIKTRSLEETNRLVDSIRSIRGVASTETMPVMKEIQ